MALAERIGQMAFKGKAGDTLSQDEVAEMLAYDNAGIVRPDEYNDVVFDATKPTGSVYRVKTAEEKRDAEAAHAADLAFSQDTEKRRLKLLKEHGIDPVSGYRLPGLRSVVGAEREADAEAEAAANIGNNAAGSRSQNR